MTEATGPEPLLAQTVTAVNGFAYGVIGADIHILASGAPLYLLANWQPVLVTDPSSLRRMPGRMLGGRRAVAPLADDDGLAQLGLWRASAARLAVRWLHGPDRQGRMSVTGRFAAESAAAGWTVMSALHGPDAEPMAPGSQDARPAGSAGLLMIVERADLWQLANLTWLLKNALLHRASTATRVLMTAHAADGWPRVRAILDTYEAGTSSQHLPDSSRASAGRSRHVRCGAREIRRRLPDAGSAMVFMAGFLGGSESGLALTARIDVLAAGDVRGWPCQRPGGLGVPDAQALSQARGRAQPRIRRIPGPGLEVSHDWHR